MSAAAEDLPEALAGCRVALLVSGGIAAYKLVALTSRLVRGACQVRVAMTPAATRFVGSTTFQGVSGNPVLTDIFDPNAAAEAHVELGDWAQVMLLAPATADVIARVAQGRADDAVTTTLLAARCPVVVAPAMNDAMWAHPAVQDNVALLRRRGLQVIEPASGRLASGHFGPGRLPEAEVLLQALAAALAPSRDLAGLRLVVSAGGTREAIDPVRYVGNRSSGKMGAALAKAAARRGAQVVLVTTSEAAPEPGVRVVPVESAREMLEAILAHLAGASALVMAAAVADFRPDAAQSRKVRREGREELLLRLVPNPDVLAAVAQDERSAGVYLVGFAAEDEGDLAAAARTKLERKQVDAIVANDIRRADIAFASDYNEAVMVFSQGEAVEIPRMTKEAMAGVILDQVRRRLR